ncbi:MAG: endonuclease [Desulfobacterium sp.]|nr:endonuclease [Desulfobacterium sp.]
MRYTKTQKKKVNHLNQLLFQKYGGQGWWPTTREPGKQPVYYPGKEGRRVSDIEAFEIIVGSILTQNNTWSNTEKAIMNLSTLNLLDVRHMMEADPQTMASAIVSARYYNQKSIRLIEIAKNLHKAGGIKTLRKVSTEELRKILLSFTGIGKETADSILCYAFSREIFVVDTYTSRLFQRLDLPCSSYEEIQNLVHCSIKPSAAEYGDLHARIVKLSATGDVKTFSMESNAKSE